MSIEENKKLNFIFSRRSIRSFKNKEVDSESIELLLAAAMSAPSCYSKDPWRFIVVRNKKTLAAIAECLPNGKMLPSAGAGIVVCGDMEAVHDRLLSFLIQDCSAAVENILLAAHALELGACWLGVHPRQERISHITKVLSLPESVVPVACIAVGYPAEHKQARTRYNKSFIHFETW